MINYNEEELNKAFVALETLEDFFESFLLHLEPQEKKRMYWVGAHHKEIIDKTILYNKRKPELSSPDVNWEQLEQCINLCKNLEEFQFRIKEISEGLHGRILTLNLDNYREVLKDYSFSKYKAKSSSDKLEFLEKTDDVSQHFPGKYLG